MPYLQNVNEDPQLSGVVKLTVNPGERLGTALYLLNTVVWYNCSVVKWY